MWARNVKIHIPKKGEKKLYIYLFIYSVTNIYTCNNFLFVC